MLNKIILANVAVALIISGFNSAQSSPKPASNQPLKTEVRRQLVDLRNLIDKQLYKLESVNNRMTENDLYITSGQYLLDYNDIVDDANRLYLDCDVLASKLGVKPLHPELVKLRKGQLYASQHRRGAD